jgi:glycosyltransferase involved in cell wall biosynthesis
MKILIVTDAWAPQKNGVVRVLNEVLRRVVAMGHDVLVIGPQPDRFFCFSLPFYPEIKIELFAASRIRRALDAFQPDAVHLPTEGPLGRAARKACLQRGLSFTTAYHSRFPQFVSARLPRVCAPFVESLCYGFLRRFHNGSCAVLVSTPSLEADLRARGFLAVKRWSLGVDLATFHVGGDVEAYASLPRPLLLYVGRVAVEKNLPAFLELKTPGTKIVVGDGPDRRFLQVRYPKALFLGAIAYQDLQPYYAAADLFVFPSKTDTFGLVLLEAAACGLRVAAFDAPGPSDVFADPEAKAFSVLDDDLSKAVDQALLLPEKAEKPRAFAEKYPWEASARSFLNYLALGC